MCSKWMSVEYLKLYQLTDPEVEEIWNVQGKGGLVSDARTWHCFFVSIFLISGHL